MWKIIHTFATRLLVLVAGLLFLHMFHFQFRGNRISVSDIRGACLWCHTNKAKKQILPSPLRRLIEEKKTKNKTCHSYHSGLSWPRPSQPKLRITSLVHTCGVTPLDVHWAEVSQDLLPSEVSWWDFRDIFCLMFNSYLPHIQEIWGYSPILTHMFRLVLIYGNMFFVVSSH